MIQVYHGAGKGKTTAAVGLLVRAAGRGKATLLVPLLWREILLPGILKGLFMPA